MHSISQVVWSQISKEPVILDLLQTGILNCSAYAAKLQPDVEKITLTKVNINSIVTALVRIREKQNLKTLQIPKFKIDDLSLKLPITELVYRKNINPNPALGNVYQNLENSESTHFNVISVQDEIDIFVSSNQTDIVKAGMNGFDLILQENQLAAINIKYDPNFRNYPGMANQILSCLAVNSINMIECFTTHCELIIYINQRLANQVLEILNQNFM